MSSFLSLGIAPLLADALKRQGITVPTPIQEAAIPAALSGRPIIGRSQTGTGKTLAYLLPALEKVTPEEETTQVLIMTPTRELARQIFDVLSPLAKVLSIDGADIIGGRTIENQIQKLKRDPHILIGTPGRLLDHLGRRTMDLSHVRMIILDEADQMLEAGFRKEIEALIDETPKKRQLLLFSATMPDEAIRLSRKYMIHPVTADVAEKPAASTVEQRIYETSATRKYALLVKHLREMNPYMALVFCNTREEVPLLADKLAADLDYKVDELRGDMTQSQRNQVIRRFEKAEIQVLVCSDVAARGIDAEGVTHVFNYGIPRNLEYYIHRIGRTGRAGEKGLAITYATPEDAELLRRLEKSIEETITRYDEEGRVRRVKKAAPRKKAVTPGMYKPTKKKEHKALGHKGWNTRQKRKKEDDPVILKKRHDPRKRPKKVTKK